MALPVAAGGIVLASDINAFYQYAWTDYGSVTTILTASTTNPTLGNSVWKAAYYATPDLVHIRFNITIGTTFSAGSGNYRILLPVAASVDAISASTGVAFIDDFGTAQRVAVLIATSSTKIEMFRDSVSSSIGSGGPGTAWATSDRVSATYTYEPA